MSEPGTANDWVRFWQDNQKSLFQAWAEGKPPAFPGRSRGRAPPLRGGCEAPRVRRPIPWATS